MASPTPSSKVWIRTFLARALSNQGKTLLPTYVLKPLTIIVLYSVVAMVTLSQVAPLGRSTVAF